MNKNVVARQIPLAYKELETSGIVVKKDEYKLIPKGYRGQISAFGAAVTMGSLIPAVAFFSKKVEIRAVIQRRMLIEQS